MHYIEDASGEVVEPPGGNWVCIDLLQHIVLGRGESLVRNPTWTGESCRWVNGERECVALPAGEYRAYGTFRALKGGREIFLRTPNVTLRLED